MTAPPTLQSSNMVSSSSQPQQTWFQRHWKGTVMAIIGLIVASFIALALGIVGLVFWSMRQSDVYRMAMTKARQNPAVVHALGTPINPGWFVSGSLSIENDSGTANLTIPIHGPQQAGKMYVDARKRMGEWTFNSLTVKTDDGDQIELVPPKPD